MLTADLVRARRRRGTLELIRLHGKGRDRALELAEALLAATRQSVGRSRSELAEAFAAIDVAPNEQRLVQGLAKLVEDHSEISAEPACEPAELRRALFERAAAAWRSLEPGARFDRAALVVEAAYTLGLTPEAAETALYADLRSAHCLLRAPALSADALVAEYERAQLQAVLLRAVRVIAEVRCNTPGAYRSLFGKLKFRQLLFTIQPLTPRDRGYRIEIDGPYSLFESVTKYGLQLALVLPALEQCDELSLVADLRWGKEREPLTFHHNVSSPLSTSASAVADLPHDVAALAEAFARLDTCWTVQAASVLCDVPGVGIVVPDLVFERTGKGDRIFFEALGYWSRDAVFKRVELVQAGLGQRFLFAASSRLRVSEALLHDQDLASLYVYKGTMSARAVERKLDELCGKLAE